MGRAHSTGDLLQQGLLPEVCCTACTKGVFTKMTKYQRDPGLCALVAYIAGDTLHHQPMGVGHVTVLQLCGPMGFRVLKWCHPMLACAKRTSYCTQFITLYGTRKVDSGPHRLLTHAKCSGQDSYLALLAYMSTPVHSHL